MPRLPYPQPLLDTAMDKKPRTPASDTATEQPTGLRWYWYYGANGWAWAYHTIFRSMQLESNSESAIDDASANGSRLNGEATSPIGKRKRDASP